MALLLAMICSTGRRRRRSSSSSSSRGLLVITLAAAAAAAALMVACNAEVPSNVSIVRVVATGSGCPNTNVIISQDKRAVTIPFGRFQVSVPTNNSAEKEKACLISIALQYPANWSYVGTAWTYEAWVDLDANMEAHQSANYYFQGGAPSCSKDHVFSGGNNGLPGKAYSYNETCDAGTVWSTCGDVRGLNVLTRIWIDNHRNPTGEGVIKSKSIEAEVPAYVLYLNWKRCT